MTKTRKATATIRPTIDLHRHPAIRTIRVRRWSGLTAEGNGIDLYVLAFSLFGRAQLVGYQGVLDLEVTVWPAGPVYPYQGRGPSCRRWEGHSAQGGDIELDVAFLRVPTAQVPAFEEEFREALSSENLEHLPDLGPPFQGYGLRQILA